MRKNGVVPVFREGNNMKAFRRALGHAVLALGFLALFSAASAFAACVVQSIQGDVRAGPIGKPVTAGARGPPPPSGPAVGPRPRDPGVPPLEHGPPALLGRR